jgi:hypothetical protein
MNEAYIDVKSLRKLLATCRELEEVDLCAGSHALVCAFDMLFYFLNY